MDLCFEYAAQVMARLADAVDVCDEVHGFRYFDERDLIGFVDGTENPVGPAAAAAVLIGDGDPDFAGGSYVIVQKYRHDMPSWNRLTVEDQEKVIGRTKLSDIEMPDEVKPANSHVALNTIFDPDGTQRQILRANMPFGAAGSGEFGTYFIGYAATPTVTEQMLRNMFIGKPPGNTDRVLAGRRVADIQGPEGPGLSAVGTGHLGDIGEPGPGVMARIRRVQPPVELRVPFSLGRRDIDDVERGAQDPDWQLLKDAAKALAFAEDRAVFEGYEAAGIEGRSAGRPGGSPPAGTAARNTAGTAPAPASRPGAPPAR